MKLTNITILFVIFILDFQIQESWQMMKLFGCFKCEKRRKSLSSHSASALDYPRKISIGSPELNLDSKGIISASPESTAEESSSRKSFVNNKAAERGKNIVIQDETPEMSYQSSTDKPALTPTREWNDNYNTPPRKRNNDYYTSPRERNENYHTPPRERIENYYTPPRGRKSVDACFPSSSYSTPQRYPEFVGTSPGIVRNRADKLLAEGAEIKSISSPTEVRFPGSGRWRNNIPLCLQESPPSGSTSQRNLFSKLRRNSDKGVDSKSFRLSSSASVTATPEKTPRHKESTYLSNVVPW